MEVKSYSANIYNNVLQMVHRVGGPLQQSHRFNPRGLPERTQVHLLCKECIGNFCDLYALVRCKYISIRILSENDEVTSFCLLLLHNVLCGRGESHQAYKQLNMVFMMKHWLTFPHQNVKTDWEKNLGSEPYYRISE